MRSNILLPGGNVRILIGHALPRERIPFEDALRRKPAREIRVKNLVPSIGIQKIRDLIAYPYLPGACWTPNYFAYGSNGAATTAATLTLGAEVFRKEVTNREPDDSGLGLKFYGYIETTECNGSGVQDLYEMGLFTEPGQGTGQLWQRAIFPHIQKNDTIYLIFESTWLLSAS